MAAKEVIHFSLWAQLGPHLLSPAQTGFGHVISSRFSLLSQYHSPLISTECRCGLSAWTGGGE
jgi:hypothetical protein